MALLPAHAQSGAGFAIAGIATGQSARVNALNLGSRASTSDSSCTVTLRFLDEKGTELKSSEVVLGAGKGAHLDLSRDQVPGEPGRTQIRAVLLFGFAGGAPPGPDVQNRYDCNIVPSFEVYDNATGKTSVVLTDTKPLPTPDPRSIAGVFPGARAAHDR